MGTKLRNIPYNRYAKIIGVIVMVIALIVIVDYQYITGLNNEYFYMDHFYESDEFQQYYVRLSHNVVEMNLDLIDEEHLEETLSGSELSIALGRLGAINDNLRRAPSFTYVLVNKNTGEIITNLATSEYIRAGGAESYIKEFETVIQWDNSGLYFPVKSVMEDQPLVYRHYNDYSEYTTTNVTASDVVYRLRSGEWIYYTAVDFDKMEDDILFGSGYYDFMEYKAQVNGQFPMLVFSMVALFLAVVFLTMVAGKDSSESDIKLIFLDYIPLEIQMVILGFSALPILGFSGVYFEGSDLNALRMQRALYTGIFIAVGAILYLSLVRLIKSRYIYKNPITLKVWWWIKDLFTLDFVNPLNKVKIFGALIVYLLLSIGLVFLMILVQREMIVLLFFGVFIVVQVVLGVYLLAIARDLTKLIEATHHRAAGETEYPINEADYKIAFKSFAGDLNALQNGLQVALDDAIRGEKMKTELITNVSHDLKNPLTSIITYIDLIEKSLILYNRDGISSEEKEEIRGNMDDYIRILNNKSYRLKTLIEDLVSASKASSGNLEVELMNINIRQLIVQILAEREEYFEAKELDVVITPAVSGPVWSIVDPNHMYRVFENLISNILKYTMAKTRVFVDVRDNEEDVTITFKNMSNHPLDYDGEDLTRRFVRGDGSRTTEGSGLGLSIVESLMKLQNGNQDVVVDGDMFKVILTVQKGQAYSDVNLHNSEIEEEKEEVEIISEQAPLSRVKGINDDGSVELYNGSEVLQIEGGMSEQGEIPKNSEAEKEAEKDDKTRRECEAEEEDSEGKAGYDVF